MPLDSIRFEFELVPELRPSAVFDPVKSTFRLNGAIHNDYRDSIWLMTTYCNGWLDNLCFTPQGAWDREWVLHCHEYIPYLVCIPPRQSERFTVMGFRINDPLASLRAGLRIRRLPRDYDFRQRLRETDACSYERSRILWANDKASGARILQWLAGHSWNPAAMPLR